MYYQYCKMQVSRTLTKHFDDQRIRLYCKSDDKEMIDILKRLFVHWCKENKFTLPSGDKLVSSLFWLNILLILCFVFSEIGI